MPGRKTTVPPSKADGSNYEVGYGRPPKHSQFRPGQSGNPAGRRKGVRNLKTDVMRTLSAPVRVKEGGRMRTRSTQETLLMVLRGEALKADPRALGVILDLAKRFNTADEVEPTQAVSPDDQAILAAYLAEAISAAEPPTNTQPDADPALTSDPDGETST